MREGIEYLLDQFEQEMARLEEDMRDSNYNRQFRMGKLDAYKEITENLIELLENEE